jgi:predicted transposase YdaD
VRNIEDVILLRKISNAEEAEKKYEEQAEKKGLAIGRRKATLQIAQNLFEMDFLTIDQIAQGLEISIEEVLQLKKIMKPK